MSLFTGTVGRGPLIQRHRGYVANDLQWIEGSLETLGNPHDYINQDGLDVFTLDDARISPWSFTGLPNSRSAQIIVRRESTQFLIFTDEETVTQFREPPRTETLILNSPLAILRGRLPFLSDAGVANFMDFWKGDFVPVMEVQIHYLAPSAADMPPRARLLYINRRAIQSYVAV